MIYELWTHLRRCKRYRRISLEITKVITEQSQLRLDKTLTDAYMKATASGADPELLKNFTQNMQGMIDRSNEILAKENAWRIRQWTTAILDEENRFESGRP